MDLLEEVIALLQGARALIAEPTGFTRYTFARDVLLRTVHPNSNDAVRWCLLGALQRSEYDLGLSKEHNLLARGELSRNSDIQIGLFVFSDMSASNEPVVELLDRTILDLESQRA